MRQIKSVFWFTFFGAMNHLLIKCSFSQRALVSAEARFCLEKKSRKYKVDEIWWSFCLVFLAMLYFASCLFPPPKPWCGSIKWDWEVWRTGKVSDKTESTDELNRNPQPFLAESNWGECLLPNVLRVWRKGVLQTTASTLSQWLF